MRIGCLQFAPQVGEVEHNLTRADAVLGRVDPADMEALDILVLPEMAFSGKSACFRSLQLIGTDSGHRLQLQVPGAYHPLP